jgi:hypothetical protein
VWKPAIGGCCSPGPALGAAAVSAASRATTLRRLFCVPDTFASAIRSVTDQMEHHERLNSHPNEEMM